MTTDPQIAVLLAAAAGHQAGGRLAEAENAVREAFARDADHAPAHNALGLVLAAQSRLEEAAASFQEAAHLDPPFAPAHNNLGVACQLLGRLDESAAAFRQAIASRPDYVDAHANLGITLQKLGQLEASIAACRRALQLRPDHAVAHNALGVAWEQSGQLNEAAESFRRALAVRPAWAEAHSNLGGVLDRLGRHDEALAALGRAVELNPHSPAAQTNLGMALEQQDRPDEAIAAYRQAIGLDPTCAAAQLNCALALLRRGDFAAGWPLYEWRVRADNLAAPRFAQPRWQGEPLAGKTILLVEEQGLGDTLQFVRYAPLLKARGATVLVRCRPQLATLVATCPGFDAVIAADAPLPDFDFYLPLPSAPGAFGTSLETIPAVVPYLAADPVQLQAWQTELAAESGFKVGIAWQGDRQYRADRDRSIPLEYFAPLSALERVRLYGLQFGAGREQLADWPGPGPIVDLGDRLGDFQHTAAIVANLDLVVTCDSSPGHLAGALGRRVWVAVPHLADWRWLAGRDDSPWYPSVCLYRQPTPGDWAEVFARMSADLKLLAGEIAPRDPETGS